MRRRYHKEQDELITLTPINFFQLKLTCPYLEEKTIPPLTKPLHKRYLLPDTSDLCSEEKFADVYLGWSMDGISLRVEVNKKVEKVILPEITTCDSVEVFIDTRDIKTSGYNTRFCHHFYFLPEAFEGRFAGEITRFRTEDSHPLCDHNDLKALSHLTKKNYALKIFIPTHCLIGYDPTQFKRIGFTYRINRPMDYPQHFSVCSEEFKIEEQPSLWSSIVLES